MLKVGKTRAQIHYTQRWARVHNIAQTPIMIMMADLSMFHLRENSSYNFGAYGM